MKVFDIAEEFRLIEDMALDPETDEEALREAYQTAMDDLSGKADNIAFVLKELDSQAKTAKEMKKVFDDKAKAYENAKARILSLMFMLMRESGNDKVEGTNFKFWIQKNPKRLVIDEENVSEEYTRMMPLIDKDKIKESLDSGEDLSFAHYEQSEGVRFR